MDLNISTLFGCAKKVVVVTGGSKGIGLMISRAFVANGAIVYCLSRKPDNKIADELSKTGPGKCIALGCDISDRKQIDQAVEAIRKDHDAIHVLVNNSGMTYGNTFERTSKKSFDDLFRVNVTGLFLCCQAFVPLLEKGATKQDPASIINVASIDGVGVPSIEEYAYSASKAAVIHLNKLLSGFLVSRNITCNCVSPGLFPSKMGDQVFKVVGEEQILGAIPMQRAGLPGDIAAPVLFLASRGGAYTTGANIVVDGGILTRPRM